MRIPEGTMIYGEADASIVLVQMVDSHDLEGIESEIAEIQGRLPGKRSLRLGTVIK